MKTYGKLTFNAQICKKINFLVIGDVGNYPTSNQKRHKRSFSCENEFLVEPVCSTRVEYTRRPTPYHVTKPRSALHSMTSSHATLASLFFLPSHAFFPPILTGGCTVLPPTSRLNLQKKLRGAKTTNLQICIKHVVRHGSKMISESVKCASNLNLEMQFAYLLQVRFQKPSKSDWTNLFFSP